MQSRSRIGVQGCVFALSALALTAAAPAAMINFDEFNTGTIFTTQYVGAHGVTISADNYRATGPNAAINFNSMWADTPDPDLEFDWSAGNLKGTVLNRFLIVAEDLRDFDKNGRVDNPDDEAQGGSLTFAFAAPQQSFGFDLIDVELTPGQDKIEFFRNGVSLKSVTFDQFTNPSSPYYDSSVVYGDRTANRIQPLTLQKLGIQAFDKVTFSMPECAAIDNVAFVAAPAVPEPTTAALLLGLLAPAGLMRARRRRA